MGFFIYFAASIGNRIIVELQNIYHRSILKIYIISQVAESLLEVKLRYASTY